MGKFEEIYEASMNQELKVRGNVVVLATAPTISGLSQLHDSLELVECGIDAMPTDAQTSNAAILVVEVDPAIPSSMDRVAQLSTLLPGRPIIAGVRALDIGTTRMLIKQGVADVLAVPFTMDDLLGALSDVNLSELTAPVEPTRLAPIVSFLGCAGGVGTTTISTHLAGAATSAGVETALIDLDIQKGDATNFLGCDQRFSLEDLMQAESRLDADLFKSVAGKRDGMPTVLAAPVDILPIEDIQFEKLSRIMRVAQQDTGLLVLDMPISLTNWSLSTLVASQLIVLVGELNVHSLRKLKRQSDFLVSMGVEKQSIKVVLNKVERGLFKMIKVDDAERVLKQPVLGSFPLDDGSLQKAQDQGELVLSLIHI